MSKRISWAPVGGPRAVAAPQAPARRPSSAERAFLQVGVPAIADALTPREDAIGLLQLAAEVEHALLVQYLYAAASIDLSAGAESRNARRRIVTIAIQEMGHLIAAQNLLLSIGGREAHHFERDDLRTASDRNPLPLVLEGVSHAALAKFITIEKPDDIADAALKQRVEALAIEAETDAQFSLHPVIALYNAIYWIFQPDDDPFGRMRPPSALLRPGWHLKPEDFIDPSAIDRLASSPDEWAGFPGLTVATVHDSAEACDLLADVMEQGEGGGNKPGDSHFTGFLRVLDAFEARRLRVLPLCRTPRVRDQAASEDSQATILQNAYAERWARLLNLRYSELVLTIAHTLSLAVDDPRRPALSGLALSMMRPGLSDVIKHLTTLDAGTSGGAKAGPPFGLLAEIPTVSDVFWRRHRTFLVDHATAVAAIMNSAEFPNDAGATLVLQILDPINEVLAALLESNP